MTSPHSVERRRIVAWAILRGGYGRLGREQSANPWIGEHPTHANRHAVQEIPACDVAAHAKLAIARSTAVFILEVSHISLRTFHLFLNRTIGLVNCCVRISAGSGVGIRNRDSSKLFPSNDARSLFWHPVWIKQRIVFVGVAVRPPIYRYCSNVAGGIESSRREHTIQLFADISFKFRKWRADEFGPAHPVLISTRQPRLAGSPQHEEHHWFLRVAGKLIRAQADRKIEHGEAVIASRRNNLSDPHFVERLPIANGNVRVDERFLHAIVQSFLLFFGQLGTKVWDHAVVTGEDAGLPCCLL